VPIVGMFDFIGKGYNIFETINKAIDKINKDINHDGN
jgi:prefoldin subunit 5